ncbi:glycoside hydrolase/deacetylase [Neocallimastix californiae]|uniref:Glycoside hydrolase/deacetylase n=1 Tax=Neocallimastix californiae TaxID=1754190 RepID=A0A1Y2AY54_9FUNG|nr:glycoside hydrolase/deacetylase [Neocallimastix californiae]|eukprot:ORY27220.1 glycoside hydrolase/deacetylase [Neocallimastix californiae]
MRLFNSISLGLATAMAVNAGKIFHCKEKNTMALTFDDGPYEYTDELLDTLDEAGIKATFFINGDNWWKDLASSSSKQKIIKRAIDGGHQVASHTWAHEIPEGKENIKKALSKLDDLVEDIAGVRPKYFRAPQGHCDEDCIEYIESLGYKIIQWDLDTKDWDYKYPGLSEKKNYLVLMHDVHKHTVKELVPWLIKNAPSQYKYVTVAECLGDVDGAYNKEGIIRSFVAGNTTTTTTETEAAATTTTQAPIATNAPIIGTSNENLNVNGAMTNSVNAVALVTILLYSLYMLF